MKNTKTSFSIALALVLALATSLLHAQSPARPSDVLGMTLVGHHVSDLERSIKFFEAIDFKVVEAPGAWTVDKEVNKLGNTPNAETRTATMRVQSSVSDVPFTLVLRQYRGVPRQDWSKANSWDLLSSHIDLTVDSVSALLDKLEALNMLKMPEISGLANPRQQPGVRRYAFIQDPDGLVIEYFGKPAAPLPGAAPAAPLLSNSSATSANIDRWGKQAGFNHYATNILDAAKAQEFYSKVFGGDYPPVPERPAAQTMLNGWFPQATTSNNLRIELGLFAANAGKTPPAVKFPDINANHVGFQVSNIETAYARAKANGAITVSEGGIIDYHKGKAALIRDSDVGGYIMLWQPPR